MKINRIAGRIVQIVSISCPSLMNLWKDRERAKDERR